LGILGLNLMFAALFQGSKRPINLMGLCCEIFVQKH
jgi:hypothetical protein